MVDDFSARLLYSKKKYEIMYAPLKFDWEINNSDPTYIVVKNWLAGGNRFRIGNYIKISRIGIGYMQNAEQIVSEYMKELDRSIEKAVIQEGIKRINETIG